MKHRFLLVCLSLGLLAPLLSGQGKAVQVEYIYTSKTQDSWSGVFDVIQTSGLVKDNSNYLSVAGPDGRLLSPLDVNTFSGGDTVVWDYPPAPDTFFQVTSDALYNDIFLNNKTWSDLISAGAYSIPDITIAGYCPGSTTCFVQQPSFPDLKGGGGTIKFTPGPLPILGAGATLGFSRKLKRRIKASSQG